MLRDDCPFCRGAAYDESLTGRRLWGSDWFSVYEDKVPIVPSHRLVIPHDHITAFAALSRDDIGDVCALLRRREAPVAAGSCTVVFEHGIRDAETVGCGVSHAHWHVLRVSEDHVRMFVDQVAATAHLQRMASPMELPAFAESYLFLWELAEESGHVFDGYKSPSQFLRKSLAQVVGTADWDWQAVTENALSQ